MQISQIWEVIFIKGWKKHYITSKPFCLAVREFLCSLFKGVHL